MTEDIRCLISNARKFHFRSVRNCYHLQGANPMLGTKSFPIRMTGIAEMVYKGSERIRFVLYSYSKRSCKTRGTMWPAQHQGLIAECHGDIISNAKRTRRACNLMVIINHGLINSDVTIRLYPVEEICGIEAR